MATPRFPIYIPSKGRADIALTPGALDEMGVPYRIVVEADEFDAYARRWGADRLLVLDRRYVDEYDACMALPDGRPKGSGPARNFIWEHSLGEGHAWHWIVDDNIRDFARLHRNRKVRVGDGSTFAAMEDFTLRYRGVAMASPAYWFFSKNRMPLPPFITGTRMMSCILIRNDIPFRWRARYNEDVDLSLRVLKAGWNTIQFYAFLQNKATTQTMRGGNTDTVYVGGTLDKSRMLAELHPDVVRVRRAFGRWHHWVDMSQWRNQPLVRRDDVEIPAASPYQFRLVRR